MRKDANNTGLVTKQINEMKRNRTPEISFSYIEHIGLSPSQQT
jgi:hypothetical protein